MRTVLAGDAALVVAVDGDGRITDFNAASERVSGYSASEVVGRTFWSALHPLEDASRIESVFDGITGSPATVDYQADWQTRAGVRRRVAWTATPFFGDGGRLSSVVQIGVEVPADPETLRDRAQRMRFERLCASVPAVVFETDRNGQVVFVSEAWEAITGYPGDAALGFGWEDILHPEDRETVLEAALETLTTGVPFEAYYRILTRAGEIRWLTNRAGAVRDANGSVTGVFGVLIDQTGLIEAGNEAQERADHAVSSAADFVVVFQPDGTLLQVSESARNLLELMDDDGRTLRDALDEPSQVLLADEAMPQVLAAGSWRGEMGLRVGGHVIPVSVSLVGHRGEDGYYDRITASARDISDLRAAQARLTEQAMRDQLTGLANRRRLNDVLSSVLAPDREPRPAILFVDLDGFKRVNDELGHEAGDELLVAVGRRLSHLARQSDTVARLGGDEFVVVCDTDSVAGARSVARRIKDQLSRPFRVGAGTATIGASVGIYHTTTADTPDTALAAADREMYAEKTVSRRRNAGIAAATDR